MQEKKNENWFGLIVGEEASDAFLHGYEVTLEGEVVVPELHPKPSIQNIRFSTKPRARRAVARGAEFNHHNLWRERTQ